MSHVGTAYLALFGAAVLFNAAPALADAGVSNAVGDLKRDGQQEIVNIDAQGGVNVLVCNPDGSFAVTSYAPGDLNSPSSVAIADVNGDGWPDVIITDSNDAATGVHVLLNKGDGTLAAETVYASGPAGTPGPLAVTVADVNGDGKPDILTANGTGNSISVLLNPGDATFPAAVQYPAGADVVALAAADLNGDGKPDLVTVNQDDNSVAVLLNNGDGSFAAPLEQPVGSGPAAVTLADVNQDGDMDIEVANQNDNTAAVLLGKGDGTFAAAVFYPTGQQPSWITTADLDGDGLPDIVTDNYSDGSVSVLANNGDGTFAPQQQVFPDYGSDNTVVMPLSTNSSPAVVSVDLQVESVVVTSTPPSAPPPGVKNPPASMKNPPTPGVYRVENAKVSDVSGHGGASGLFGLAALGALLAHRRTRPRAAR